MIKINFGSGPYPIAGWINVDLDPAGRPEVVADLGRALPFATGVADFIHTEDFIAQLDPIPLLGFLRECRRILKPAGALRKRASAPSASPTTKAASRRCADWICAGPTRP